MISVAFFALPSIEAMVRTTSPITSRPFSALAEAPRASSRASPAFHARRELLPAGGRLLESRRVLLGALHERLVRADELGRRAAHLVAARPHVGHDADQALVHAAQRLHQLCRLRIGRGLDPAGQVAGGDPGREPHGFLERDPPGDEHRNHDRHRDGKPEEEQHDVPRALVRRRSLLLVAPEQRRLLAAERLHLARRALELRLELEREQVLGLLAPLRGQQPLEADEADQIGRVLVVHGLQLLAAFLLVAKGLVERLEQLAHLRLTGGNTLGFLFYGVAARDDRGVHRAGHGVELPVHGVRELGPRMPIRDEARRALVQRIEVKDARQGDDQQDGREGTAGEAQRGKAHGWATFRERT
jgi:hypothetical protein